MCVCLGDGERVGLSADFLYVICFSLSQNKQSKLPSIQQTIYEFSGHGLLKNYICDEFYKHQIIHNIASLLVTISA